MFHVYIINLTFYAGSNAEEDTDRELYIVKTDKPYTEAEFKKLISDANSICNEDENKEFPYCYYNDGCGLNSDTLMNTVAHLNNFELIDRDNVRSTMITAIYDVEQWQ